MSDRAHWIEHAHSGVTGQEAPDARALAILETSKQLSNIAETDPEKQTLVRLTRAAIRMASVRGDEARTEDVLSEIEAAWQAFEVAWCPKDDERQEA